MPPRKPSAKAASKPAAKAVQARKTATRSKAAPGRGLASRAATSMPRRPAVANVVTLRHLATEMAEHHELPKRQADELIRNVVEMMVQHLKDGDRLRIGGLGILEVKSRPARMGRNPATGEAIQIKASRKIAFRPAKELKEAI